jgi:hypothetical protein
MLGKAVRDAPGGADSDESDDGPEGEDDLDDKSLAAQE